MSATPREPVMGREDLRILTQHTLVPVGAVLAAVTITIACMGYFNHRDSTSAEDMAALRTRVALLEADNKILHASADGVETKIEKLTDSINDLRVRLGAPPSPKQ